LLSVYISRKPNSLTDVPILIKLYIVVVYNLGMYIRQDYSREIIVQSGGTLTVLV